MLNNLQQWWQEQLQTIQQKPNYQRWRGLQNRERLLIKLMLTSLLLLILYWFIWQPIMIAKQQAQQNLQHSQETWLWLNQQQLNISTNNNTVKAVTITNQSQLINYVQQQISIQNLQNSVEKLTPLNRRNGVKIQFKQVKSPNFFRWLSKIEQEAVIASELTINKVKKGIINVTVVFEVKQ